MSLDPLLEKTRRKLCTIFCVSVLLHSRSHLREMRDSHSTSHGSINRLNFKAFSVNSLQIKDIILYFLNMCLFL